MGAVGDHRGRALVGLAGALLAGVGDLLILGRPASGRDFDRADGLVPPALTDDRWRSLWNGVEFPQARIRLGSAIGIVGIGLLSGCGLRGWEVGGGELGGGEQGGSELGGSELGGAARALPSCPRRDVATVSVAVFAVAGALTHHGCSAGVLARQAVGAGERSGRARQPPDQPDRLLTVSAAVTLTALAVLSLDLTLTAHRRGGDWRRRAAATPFPWVLAMLATTGRLPAPVGGYLRPASISCGLLLSLAVTVSAGVDRRPVRPGDC